MKLRVNENIIIGSIDELHERGTKKATEVSMKMKDDVGMGGPKNAQRRFVGVIMHVNYTSLCFLF